MENYIDGNQNRPKGAERLDNSSNLIVTIDGPVQIVAINRPDRRNAIDMETANNLVEVFKQFDANDDLRVAVLTGTNGNFCAGADLKAISQGTANKVHEEGDAPLGISRMRLSKPVVAAIEGYAVAGGLELAIWCDLRVVGESAVLGVFCRRFGVPLVDLGTIRLPRLIGQSRAMDMILTGRGVHSSEALQFGLANRVVEDGRALEEAVSIGKSIAAFPQICMRNDRTSLYEQWDLSTESAVKNEVRLGLETIRSGETLSGASTFLEGLGRHGKSVEE